MEFVGKSLKKEFKGHGVFDGVVQSYDSSSGFCRILYKDGDSEEIHRDEVDRWLSNSGPVGEKLAGKKVGRKPKKRRRNGVIDPGKFDDSLDVNGDNLGANDGNLGENGGNLDENLVVEPQLGLNLENLVDVDLNVDYNDHGTGNGDLEGGLDLNRGLEVDEGVENERIVGGIDLNVSVEGSGFDEDGVNEEKAGSSGGWGAGEGKKERGFDLNMGLDDEGANGVCGVMDVKVSVSLGEDFRNGDGGEVVFNNVDRRSDGPMEVDPLESTTPVQCEDGNSGRRKRRKVEKNLSSPSKTVLRRSSRRSKTPAITESTVTSVITEAGVNDTVLSGVTEESSEKPVASYLEKVVELEVTPLKIELPPSSTNLNLEGIPVADLFSVYSCLRSFSTLLFLSPFELEDFVSALKSRDSNHLIDSIHVAVLQKLRIHLVSLANEGCESASTCLRNLNWDLLDEITWSVFMVDYLLIHGSQPKPGFSLERLKLFDGGYYQQPADLKIELLRCLCDDVIEVESIRAELKRRIATDVNMEVDRTVSSDRKKKSLDASADFLLSEDVEDVPDGNSDECCLCKMDGNLICCDGCPAAYHSKCVGIISGHLPEGDWYCPECVINRSSFSNKPRKSSRGADLLGIDPHGRLFFSCFDYLLVSDSYDAESSFCYYHKDDLSAVIQLLQSSDILYGSIVSAITQHWVISTDLCQPKGVVEPENYNGTEEVLIKKETKSSIIGCLSHEGNEGSQLPDMKHCTVTESPLTSSDASDEVIQANGLIQNPRSSLSNVTARGTLAKRISASKRKKKRFSSGKSKSSSVKVKEEDRLQGSSRFSYVNSYKFAHTAASVVEELLRKPSDKVCTDVPKTEEEIIAIQLRLILMKTTKLCWTTIQELNGERQKEKCGWCYCCRFPVEGRVCLFNLKSPSFISETLKAESDDILLKRNNKGHLVDLICYILCMEERLKGLLLGPWLSPQYSELWRNRVLKACDVSSLKTPLIMLVSSLHPLAISPDWLKHVDHVTTMGSASHFVASSRVNPKNVIARKKGRYADTDIKSSTAGSGLALFWWRGGRTSRSIFNWKVIPHSLASKAARKGGCMKIPELLYSDSAENTRRSKYVAWQAAVEAAVSSVQLALQVRELDLFIRWDDIENNHPHFLLDKESLKSIRLFKKVTLRRKSMEGASAKYLLDFGKRRSIPEVVIKHGVNLEDSDSERKRYWLNESHVPLYLLKSFEERRIIRKAGKMIKKGHKVARVTKKTSKEKGFEYLFQKADMADSYQCGHCNKNVPMSEAVSCQHCNGFFHKRHVMKSSEGVTARCTYTCHRCRASKQVKPDSRQGSKKIGKLPRAKNLKIDRKRLSISKAKLKKDRKPLPSDRRVSPRIAKKLHTPEKKKSTSRKRAKRNGKKLSNHQQQIGEKSSNHQQQIAEKSSNHEQRSGRKLTKQVQPLTVENSSDGITLRRSARKSKSIALQPDVLVGGVKRKRNDCSDAALKKASKSSLRKRRTQILHSYWINGLRLSGKPNDERITNFRRKHFFVGSELSSEMNDQPKCSLCVEKEFEPALMYIACDICGDWFHGGAFGLNEGISESLIGFKCHVCRETTAPICPVVDITRSDAAPSVEASIDQTAQISSVAENARLLETHNGEDPLGVLEPTEKCAEVNPDQHEAAPSVEASIDQSAQISPPPVAVIQAENARLLEFHNSEDPPGLLEPTENCAGGNPDQHEAAPSVEASIDQSAQISPPLPAVNQTENAPLLESHISEDPPGPLESTQKCAEGNPDQHEAQLLYPELSMEDASHGKIENPI